MKRVFRIFDNDCAVWIVAKNAVEAIDHYYEIFQEDGGEIQISDVLELTPEQVKTKVCGDWNGLETFAEIIEANDDEDNEEPWVISVVDWTEY